MVADPFCIRGSNNGGVLIGFLPAGYSRRWGQLPGLRLSMRKVWLSGGGCPRSHKRESNPPDLGFARPGSHPEWIFRIRNPFLGRAERLTGVEVR